MMAMAVLRSRAHAGSATQRPILPSNYGKRKRGSSETHRSLQSARDTVEKKEGEGSADGAGELQKGKKWKKRGKRRGKGKRRGRWGVPALGGVDCEEGEARASPVEPIYRLARPVSRW